LAIDPIRSADFVGGDAFFMLLTLGFFSTALGFRPNIDSSKSCTAQQHYSGAITLTRTVPFPPDAWRVLCAFLTTTVGIQNVAS
jgi:hypothetical protein